MTTGTAELRIGTVPDDWNIAALGQVLTFEVGFPFSSSWFNEAGVGLRLIRNGDLKTDAQPVWYSGPYSDYYVVANGDLLIGMDGTFSPVRWDKGIALLNQRVGRIKPSSGVSVDYLTYALIQPLKRIEDATSATTVKHLSHSDVEDITLPLPPLHEQRAIGAVLRDVDLLIGSLGVLIAKKRDVKTATRQALMGATRRLPGFVGDWQSAKLEDAAQIDPDALSASTPHDYEFRYISLEDVNRGRLRGYSKERFASAPSRARRIVRHDDVLLGTVRPNLQSHLLFTQSGSDWIASTGFAVIRPRSGVLDAAFLFHALFSGGVVNQINATLAGSNYPAISSGDVRDLEISLPPIEEQEAIAEVLSDMDSEIEGLVARRHKTARLKQGMMQDLLTGRTRLV